LDNVQSCVVPVGIRSAAVDFAFHSCRRGERPEAVALDSLLQQ
jgi:hypothetical protein